MASVCPKSPDHHLGCLMQATQLAALHTRHAQQARKELELVRRRAADSIRASSISMSQLCDLDSLIFVVRFCATCPTPDNAQAPAEPS